MKMFVDPTTGKPPRKAFTTVPVGKSLSNEVNPAFSYAWGEDGYYYIRVRQPNPEVNTYEDVMSTFVKVKLVNVAKHKQRIKTLKTLDLEGVETTMLQTDASIRLGVK